MSKKVLIIRSTVVTKDSHLQRDAKTLAESIVHAGFVMLPANYTYEFGEIDGVVWEGEKKEQVDISEKKPEVDLDYLIARVECMKFVEGFGDHQDVKKYTMGANDALKRVVEMLEELKEKQNENLRDSEN